MSKVAANRRIAGGAALILAVSLVTITVVAPVSAATSHTVSFGAHGAVTWTVGKSVSLNLKAIAPGAWTQELWSGTCASPTARLALLPFLVVPTTATLKKTTKTTLVPAQGPGVILRMRRGIHHVCAAFVKPSLAVTPSPSPSPSPDAGTAVPSNGSVSVPMGGSVWVTILESVTGSGIKDSAYFTAPAEWQINWKYDCTDFGMAGNFIVSVYINGQDSLFGVNELNVRGSGTEYVHGGAGQVYLSINSECDWNVFAFTTSKDVTTTPSGYLLQVTGSGSKDTATFTAPATWKIGWAYDCTKFGMPGNFIVDVYVNGGLVAGDINEVNTKGSGVGKAINGAGQAYLSITSECDWAVNASPG